MRKETDADAATFLVILEFLYTGHAPLDQGVDPVAVLILADRYNISRLGNLCELFITKLVDKKCFKNIEKADVDVIGLLGVANVSTMGSSVNIRLNDYTELQLHLKGDCCPIGNQALAHYAGEMI